jgi:hypothetical protein
MKKIDYEYVDKNLRTTQRGNVITILDRKISKKKIINISPLLSRKTLIIAGLTALGRGDYEIFEAINNLLLPTVE